MVSSTEGNHLKNEFLYNWGNFGCHQDMANLRLETIQKVVVVFFSHDFHVDSDE
jgi:hypothetical protein